MFDYKYKDMIMANKTQSDELKNSFTNEVKNLTTLKDGLYKEYKESLVVRDEF